MKKSKFLFNLTSIILSIFLFSCTPNNLNSIKHNSPISIQGTITKIGNSPFEKIAVYIPKYKTSIVLSFKFQSHKQLISNSVGKKIKLKGLFQISDRKIANSNQKVKLYSLLVTAIN